MSLIVMKFGGDALGDKGKGKPRQPGEPLAGATFHPEKFQAMARLVRSRVDAGHRIVVVVSAMGNTTNRLLDMARALQPCPPERELDMLMFTGEQQSIALFAIALQAEGLRAVSLTGAQVGIITDVTFGRARIQTMDTARLEAAIAEGVVPVVAGFQGATEDNELTTLGRGGSDITAVAVAAAIRADVCEFFKDVEGIYTTDPRIYGGARKIERISYDEMLELASLGAGVLQSRSVEFAKNYNVPLHVLSYVENVPGTFVVGEDKSMEDRVFSGVTFSREEGKLVVLGVPDKPGIAADLFTRLGEANIVVDMIIQTAARDGVNDIGFTIPRPDFNKALVIARQFAADVKASGIESDNTIGKISAVGVGMRSHVGVAAKMFRALAQAGINIQMISTSEIKISCVIEERQIEDAVRAVHAAFDSEVSALRPA